MQFITFAALLTSAAAAPALQHRQSNATIADDQPFGLIAIRSGSDLQYSSFAAAQGGLSIGLASQGAACASATETATFFLSNGTLNLYTPSNVTQQLYTDRSGMGQGVLQYSTTPGGAQPGRNSETQGWVVDTFGDLTFDGASLLACPSGNTNATASPYTVWVSAGAANPAGNANCLGVVARAVPATTPVACTYSYTPSS